MYMTHEAKKATKEIIDKAIEASIDENQELLDRLRREEMIFTKKMKQGTG
jgi:hypothetical protein